MNNKEFITELSEKTALNAKDVTRMTNALIEEMTVQLEDESVINILGFGNFEVKKKNERILVNPQTKQRMLVPPKLTINFKPNTTLKDRAR